MNVICPECGHDVGHHGDDLYFGICTEGCSCHRMRSEIYEAAISILRADLSKYEVRREVDIRRIERLETEGRQRDEKLEAARKLAQSWLRTPVANSKPELAAIYTDELLAAIVSLKEQP